MKSCIRTASFVTIGTALLQAYRINRQQQTLMATLQWATFDDWAASQWQRNDHGEINIPMDKQLQLAEALVANNNRAGGTTTSTRWFSRGPRTSHRCRRRRRRTPWKNCRSRSLVEKNLEHEVVRSEGIHVQWLRQVFLSLPEIQAYLEFDCRMWFVRTAGVMDLLQRRGVRRGGCLLDHLDCVSGGLTRLSDGRPVTGTATTFVSLTGNFTLRHFVDILLEQLPNEYVWIDTLCVDQFAWTQRKDDAFIEFKQQFMHSLQDRIGSIGKTALILNRWDDVMEPLSRVWVVWEVFCTVQASVDFKVLITDDEKERFWSSVVQSPTMNETILGVYSGIDVRNASASKKSDYEAILSLVENGSFGGTASVNQQVVQKMREWMVDLALGWYQQASADTPGYPLLCNNIANLLLNSTDEATNDELKLIRSIYDTGLHHAMEQFGPTHPTTLTIIHNMVRVVKDSETRNKSCRMACEGRKAILGPWHRNTLSSISSSAQLLADEGSLEEAIKLMREVVEAGEKHIGVADVYVLTWTSRLARFLFDQGRLIEADELLTLVVNRKEENSLIDYHTNTLGVVKLELGNAKQAEDLFRSSHRKSIVLGSATTFSSLLAMGNIAKAMCKQGRVQEAMTLQHDVYSKCVDSLGEHKEYTLLSLQNLAWMHHESGNCDAAEEIYQDSLERFSQNSLESHDYYFRALHGFANLLSDLYRLDEAGHIFGRVIDHRTQLRGDRHPKVISAHFGLAQVRLRENLVVDAFSICQTALGGVGICYGMSHARARKALELVDQLALPERDTAVVDEELNMLRTT